VKVHLLFKPLRIFSPACGLRDTGDRKTVNIGV
jgi:hypothetical protein